MNFLKKLAKVSAQTIESAARCSESMRCPSVELMQKIIEESFQNVPRFLGSSGGAARAKNLPREEKTRIGKLGAKARWHKAGRKVRK